MKPLAAPVFAVALAAAPIGNLFAAPVTPPATPLITAPADDASVYQLRGERAAPVAASRDLGPIPDSILFTHMKLILKRSLARQAALDELVSEQLKPGTPTYTHWIKPADLFPAFGPAPSDIEKIVAWLQRRGFVVHGASADGMTIDFNGTARQLNDTFRTELHELSYHGESHFANVTEPAIPMAFRDVVAGITLHNFLPKPGLKAASLVKQVGKMSNIDPASPAPDFAIPVKGQGIFQAIGPNDYTLIYNVDPLRTGTGNFGSVPLTGAGTTIAVLEDSDMQPKDWRSFRKAFGYAGYKGRLSFQHPGDCGDPGINFDEGEASLDVEYAGIAAPDADIILASCPSANFNSNSGLFTALENMVSFGTPAQIISVSYIYCESGYGPTTLQAWNQAAEEAAAEGISIFVAAGDSGSAACNNPNKSGLITSGLAVNGLASSPYVTAVGGTDFSDLIDGQGSTYFSSTNRTGFESALSYVPEVTWNTSCANPILQKLYYKYGLTTATDPISFCNSEDGALFLTPYAGGGGRSAVYAKPDWQTLSVYGMPDDRSRDLPDVSLFASTGFFGHYILYCDTTAIGSPPCNYRNNKDALNSAGGGGTSFSTPIFAGIMLLETQLRGMQMNAKGPVRIGNVAPRLYQLAAAQFSTDKGICACNASLGNKIGEACVFNNVTRSSISVACQAGSPDCYTNDESTQGIGLLSEDTRTGKPPAYNARPGYSLATGLGSVNALNLLNAY